MSTFTLAIPASHLPPFIRITSHIVVRWSEKHEALVVYRMSGGTLVWWIVPGTYRG